MFRRVELSYLTRCLLSCAVREARLAHSTCPLRPKSDNLDDNQLTGIDSHCRHFPETNSKTVAVTTVRLRWSRGHDERADWNSKPQEDSTNNAAMARAGAYHSSSCYSSPKWICSFQLLANFPWQKPMTRHSVGQRIGTAQGQSSSKNTYRAGQIYTIRLL